jgi:hypothetical protein
MTQVRSRTSRWWLPASAGIIAATFVATVFLARLRLDGGIAIGVVLGLALGMVARPRWGYYLLLFTVVLADLHLWSFSPWTDRLGFYLFQNWWKLLSSGGVRRFDYLVVNSTEVFLLAIAAGLVIQLSRIRARPAVHAESILAVLYLATLTVMLAYGMLSGGELKPALWQIRPFVHFVVFAVLGAQLLQRVGHLWHLIWTFAAASVIKAIQIIWIFVVEAGARFGDRREILGHEDSVFLAATLVLAVALALHGTGGAQRWFLLASAPVVLAGLVVNLRRASYAALALSLLLTPVLLHGQRRRAARSMVACGALFALYAAAAWNRPHDTFAAPFHKLVSIVAAPVGSIDDSSNLYRVKESLNLQRTIMAHPQGLGFGHPLEIHIPVPDISFLVPHWQYEPHNMILGIWMSLGTVGFIVFATYMVSLVMLASHGLRRHTDPYLKAVSYFLLTSLISALFVGAVDQFIWLDRGSMFLGALAAMVSAVSRLRPGASTA